MLILHALFFKFSSLHPLSNLYTLVSHLLTAFSTSSMFTSLGTCLSQKLWPLVLTLSHENKTMVSEKHSLIKHYNKSLCSSFNSNCPNPRTLFPHLCPTPLASEVYPVGLTWCILISMASISMVPEVFFDGRSCYSWCSTYTLFPEVSISLFSTLKKALLTCNAKGIHNHCVQYSVMDRRNKFIMAMAWM